MKQLLSLLVAVLLLGSVKGQTFDPGIAISGQEVRPWHTMDTVKCIMLVSDTVHYTDEKMMGWRSTSPYQAYGYVVYTWESDRYNEMHYWDFVKYLDENKKPLKYFVWLSKQIP